MAVGPLGSEGPTTAQLLRDPLRRKGGPPVARIPLVYGTCHRRLSRQRLRSSPAGAGQVPYVLTKELLTTGKVPLTRVSPYPVEYSGRKGCHAIGALSPHYYAIQLSKSSAIANRSKFRGGHGRERSDNLLRAKQILSQLSYAPTKFFFSKSWWLGAESTRRNPRLQRGAKPLSYRAEI